MVRAKIKAGSFPDAVATFSNNPLLTKEENELEKKACGRRRYELAVIRNARFILSSWGWKGVGDDDRPETYDALLFHFNRISGNCEGFIRKFFKSNPATHKFLWFHGNAMFKGLFPWSDTAIAREIPEEVQRIIKFFNGEVYYPRYDIDVVYERRRLFVSDRWDGNSASDRKQKFRQWQSTQPISL